MKVKTKKQNEDGIVRLETSGQLKEVLINEDLLHPKEASVSICFRGENSSGIIELTPEEIDIIYKQVAPKLHMLGNVKILKFKKE